MKQSRESYMEKAVTTSHRDKPVTGDRAHRRRLARFRPKHPQPTDIAADDPLGLSLDDAETCFETAHLDGQRRAPSDSKGAEGADV